MTFTMWGWLHIVFILSPIIFFVILHFIAKGKTYKQKQTIGIIVAIIAVILLLLRNIEIFITNGYKLDAELIPLQICHFANFVLLFAFLKDNKTLFGLAYCLNLPAAIMSIIFANSLENYLTMFTFKAGAYLFGHMIIVGVSIFAVAEGFVVLNKKIIRNTLITILIIFISSLLISNILNIVLGLDANYFYALKPEEGTPIEWFYNWGSNIEIGKFIFNPLYLLLTGLLGVVVVLCFCGLYKVIDKYWLSKQKNV